MADPVFDAVLRRERDEADTAVLELLAVVRELLGDELDPDADPAGLVVSELAKAGVRRAVRLSGRARPATPPDRSVATLDDLVEQLRSEGHELERAALDMTGPDFVNAHQGRALGLRQAAMRLADHIASTDRVPA